MTEVCTFCGEGDTDERGAPMHYEEQGIFAHIDCAIENDVGQE